MSSVDWSNTVTVYSPLWPYYTSFILHDNLRKALLLKHLDRLVFINLLM